MPETKPTNDMPIGVALLFTLIGSGLLVALLWGLVVPTLWVRFAYLPARATVLQVRPTERAVKGGRIYGLEAELGYSVAGREYRSWVALPLTTRRHEGPEAEAVRQQAGVGERVPCFYDPIRPGANPTLQRGRFEWSMLGALAFALIFLLVGAAGLVSRWKETFPRGLAVEVADVAGRLSRRFFLALAGLTLMVLAGLALFISSGPGLGLLALPVFLGAIVGVIAMIHLTVRWGAVAFPSPEERAAARAKKAPSQATPFSPAARLQLERGERLPFRLQSDFSGSFDALAGLNQVLLFAVVVAGLLLVRLVGPVLVHLVGNARALRLAAVPGFFMMTIGLVTAFTVHVVRFVRQLSVEVSDYPLRAGSSAQVSITHSDPARLDGLRLSLVCEEETFPSGVRGGKNSRRKRIVELPLPLEPGRGSAFTATLLVPANASPTLALAHQAIDWHVNVHLRSRLLKRIGYPVRVLPAALEATSPEPKGEMPADRIDDDQVALWLEGHPAVISPGTTLAGGYQIRPDEERPLRTLELSVVWSAGESTGADLGVCHYEQHEAINDNDLSLYGRHRFKAVLPAGPPSHDGPLVKIRWAVRLRLRYADGAEVLHELPFRLGTSESTPEKED
jgi:hypothetical protein